jgi:hypothetical protein
MNRDFALASTFCHKTAFKILIPSDLQEWRLFILLPFSLHFFSPSVWQWAMEA